MACIRRYVSSARVSFSGCSRQRLAGVEQIAQLGFGGFRLRHVRFGRALGNPRLRLHLIHDGLQVLRLAIQAIEQLPHIPLGGNAGGRGSRLRDGGRGEA